MPWMKAQFELQKLRGCLAELFALSAPGSDLASNIEGIATRIADAVIAGLDADFAYLAFPVAGELQLQEVIRCRRGMTDISTSLTAIRAVSTESTRPHDAASPAFLIDGLGTKLVCKAIEPGEHVRLVAGSTKAEFPSEGQHILLDVAVGQLARALERQSAAENAKRLATLVEHSSDFIGIADLEGRPIYINPAGMQLVGLDSLDDLPRLRIPDFVAVEDRRQLLEHYWHEVIRNGRWIGELRVRHFKSGRSIPAMVDWFLIEDPVRGVPINFATVMRDLTRQKRAEDELRRLNENLEERVLTRTRELAEANKQLVEANAKLEAARMELLHASRLSAAGQMAAALAHELNQPLTAVTNSVNAARRLIAKNGLDPRLLSDILVETAEEAVRAGQIIRRLRDFVDRGESNRRVESLPRLVEEASAFALAGAGALGVEVRIQTDQGAVAVLADRIQIQQVLVNLMRNALEAMQDCERRELEVSTALVDPQTAEVTISDSGIGLSDHMREHLFEPFFSTRRDGMGLGLSICQSIVERHGGRIKARPNPGGGAVFSFTLAAVSEQTTCDA
jgi:PAS domain S-box-containing protein